MPTAIENRTTEDLLTNQLPLYVSGTNGNAILAELTLRLIKENDSDDSQYYRGGVRPTHQPGNP